VYRQLVLCGNSTSAEGFTDSQTSTERYLQAHNRRNLWQLFLSQHAVRGSRSSTQADIAVEMAFRASQAGSPFCVMLLGKTERRSDCTSPLCGRYYGIPYASRARVS